MLNPHTFSGEPKILDISTTSVDNHIKWFKEREVLERIGNDRNGYWKINID